MSKYIFFLFVILSSCSISNSEKDQNEKASCRLTILKTIDNDAIDSLRCDSIMRILIAIGDSISYPQTLKNIQLMKRNLDEANVSIDSISGVFTAMLTRQVIPHWYGTSWDFNGYTDKPSQGSIACGYFVSTTLKHLGLNLNRYLLAQQSPLNEARSLSQGESIIIIDEVNKTKRISEVLASVSDGIHFVGFDASHVGYLYKSDDDLFVIHSNYLGNVAVSIEDAFYSPVFDSFSKLYIVELTNNDSFLQSWLQNTKFEIVQ